MRRWWWGGLWLLVALGSRAIAVQYVPAGIQLQVKVTNPPLLAGQPVTVGIGQPVQLALTAVEKVNVVDQNGVITRQLDETIKISVDAAGMGTLQKLSAGDNPLQINWISPARAGNYALYITATDSGRYAEATAVRQLVEVRVQQPGGVEVPTVRVSAQPQRIMLRNGATTTIAARVLGNDAAGKEVRFFTTGGTLSATRALTDATGQATVTLTAGRGDIGAITVSAFYGTTTATTAVQVIAKSYAPGTNTLPPLPSLPIGYGWGGLTVDVTPATLPADGQSAAVVTIRSGYPGQPVLIRATAGIVTPTAAQTDLTGCAVVTLTAPDTAQGGYVIATIGALNGYAPVNFTAPTAAPPDTAPVISNEPPASGQPPAQRVNTGPPLDIRAWSGQQTAFVADNWVQRQLRAEQGTQAIFTQHLQLLGADGEVSKDIDLGKDGKLIHDQQGRAVGYAVSRGDKALLMLLRPDGGTDRSLTIPLAIGSQLREAQYANPAGNLLVTIAAPDGTRPEVYYYGSDWITPLLAWKDGLEALPLLALGGDGVLAAALPGGTVRLYNAGGQKVAEGQRLDRLPATALAVGPGGEWVAVASAQPEQTREPARVTVFAGGSGLIIATFSLEARTLAPISKSALAVATADHSYLLDLAAKRIAWDMPGGFTRCLAVGDLAIFAGQRDGQTNHTTTRLTVARLDTGAILLSQPYLTGEILALLPPDPAGNVGLISSYYAFRFKLPAEE